MYPYNFHPILSYSMASGGYNIASISAIVSINNYKTDHGVFRSEEKQ